MSPFDAMPQLSNTKSLAQHNLHLMPWDGLYRAAILLGLAVTLYVSFRWALFQPLLRSAEEHHWTRFIVHPSILWMLMGVLMLVFRTLLWFRYRTPESAVYAEAPPLTVVIPAYNEGPMVAQSIDSVAAAFYPHGRLEIFVVDDGSRDDTWEHIEAAARRHPGLVTTLRFEKNRGKRAALEAGFRHARGDIVVTIDSDSVIERGTLLAMAGPFRDPKVGAVAGKVTVYNRGDGLIPRMLKVRYALSFDYLRAVQSTYGTVYCCPGALAGYRASVVRAVLDDWVQQRFFGVACTYGEDRSMTNYILAQGYDTVYQRAAVVHTVVPHSYMKLCKMFLRWDRSYIREEIRFAGIVWKRPLTARAIAVADAFVTNLRYPISWAALALLVAIIVWHPATLLRFLCAIGIMACLNMLYYLRSERSWDFVYGIFYSYYSAFALFWVFPYAVLTVRAKSWLTR
ncbi:MAG: glycosyltransferase [Gammaproteobacteria bacterium]|nr:glycosyltransferase [Gammaproteobacteria bacterium]MDE1983992.1 glycosyltransferase [Gammaproteobacteria bacterium]